MRKVLIILFAVFCLHSVFAEKSDKLNVYVSIMPQKYFADKVGGDLVNVSVLVPSGTSPENFDPSPKQIMQLGSSDVYFTIDIPFENIFLDKIKTGKKKLVIADCGKNVPKLRNQEHKEHEHEHGHDHAHARNLRDIETILRGGALTEHADTVVNRGLAVRGVRMAALLREDGGRVKVSLRAVKPDTVSGIAAAFGGGGHAQAAGCILDLPLAEAAERIAQRLCAALDGGDA